MIAVLEVLAWIVLFVLAYLCGSIPFGLVIGKLFYHVDVREHGSGNVGTTNVMRVLGKKAGTVVLVCDMLKGYIPTIIAAWLFGPWPTIFIAAAPVVGHVYSIFLKGKGGKGIATGAAVVLALVPLIFAIIILIFLVLLVTVRYVSIASLSAASAVPFLAVWFGEPLPYEIAAVLVAVLLWWAHRGNLKRLVEGTEHRARMPWTRRDGGPVAGNGGVGDGGRA